MSAAATASLTYVVTGASRGLGLEFVKQISANSENTVYALARNPTESKDLQELALVGNVFLVKMDVSSEASIRSAAEEVAKLAPNGIDILINNAGIGGNSANTLNITRKDYLNVFETNIFGVSDATQAFVPLLRKRGQDNIKRILNMSSILGSISLVNGAGGPDDVGAAYSVSKTALNMMTKLNANELAKENFVVIAMHPGWVRTELGTQDAPVSIQDSISGMLKTLNALSLKDNGEFFDFEGKTMPW